MWNVYYKILLPESKADFVFHNFIHSKDPTCFMMASLPCFFVVVFWFRFDNVNYGLLECVAHVYSLNCLISNQNGLLLPMTWTLACFLGTKVTHLWMCPNATSRVSCCPEICQILCLFCPVDPLLHKGGTLLINLCISGGHIALCIVGVR